MDESDCASPRRRARSFLPARPQKSVGSAPGIGANAKDNGARDGRPQPPDRSGKTHSCSGVPSAPLNRGPTSSCDALRVPRGTRCSDEVIWGQALPTEEAGLWVRKRVGQGRMHGHRRMTQALGRVDEPLIESASTAFAHGDGAGRCTPSANFWRCEKRLARRSRACTHRARLHPASMHAAR